MQQAANPLLGYYKWHARIYDATRWSFLFGRDRLVRLTAEALPKHLPPGGPHLVEVGCGTGRNLAALAKAFPTAQITGIDLSPPMLARAERSIGTAASRTRLLCTAYDRHTLADASADMVIFSYALSMFNPGFDAALSAARVHLRPGGIVAVVDFRTSPVPWFRAWMRVNHVRMDGHLPPALAARFTVVHDEIRSAYGGLWDYFCCIGRAV